MAAAFYDVTQPEAARAAPRLHPPVPRRLRRHVERDPDDERRVLGPAGVHAVLARHDRRVGAGDGPRRARRPERARRTCRTRSSPIRSERRIVDVIDIRYWAYTADGGLYAPKAARTSRRGSTCGRRGRSRAASAAIVKAVREYRTRFPDKAVTYYAEQNCPSTPRRLGGAHRRRLARRREVTSRRWQQSSLRCGRLMASRAARPGAWRTRRANTSSIRPTWARRWS